MSKRQAAFPSAGMGAEEAEEFMALLLAAQSTTHKCSFCDYFRKAYA